MTEGERQREERGRKSEEARVRGKSERERFPGMWPRNMARNVK